jgi:Chaperone of endosialidase
MANTIQLLSYANTFGDWIITTNELIQQNNNLVANSYVKPTGTLFLNDPTLGLQASNTVITGTLQVQGSSTTIQNNLNVGGNIQANNISVTGNIALSGTTVFNANNFTLNANNNVANTSTITINRGSSGLNAVLRWNEPLKYWDMLDVSNTNYYRVVTTEIVSNDINESSTSTIPSSSVTYAISNLAQAAFNQANTLSGGSSSDNVARVLASSSYNQANTATNNAASASLYANTGINNAASASLYANTAIRNAASASQYANTGINNAASASIYANNGINLAQAAFNKANTSSGGGILFGSDATLNSLGVGPGVDAPGNSGDNGGITLNGNLNLTGTNGKRIRGKFTGAPHSSRLRFQDNFDLTGGPTSVGAIPPPNSTTSTGAHFMAYASTDPDNSATVTYGGNPSTVGIGSGGTVNGIASSSYSGLPINFYITPVGEVARFVNSGNMLIATTADLGSGYNLQVGGSIVATNFYTFSDYRLKENVQPITSALDKVMKLNPVSFKWIKNGKESDGFLAHELQEVLPEAVTGVKDQTTPHGRPIYQNIDKSSLIANLTAAIQELNAKVSDLESKLKDAGVSGF